MKFSIIKKKICFFMSIIFVMLFVSFPQWLKAADLTVTPLSVEGQRVTQAPLMLSPEKPHQEVKLSLTNFTSQNLPLTITSVTPVMLEDGSWSYQKGTKNQLSPMTQATLTESTTKDFTLSLTSPLTNNQGEFYGGYLFQGSKANTYLPYVFKGQPLTKVKDLALSSFKGKVVEDKPGVFLKLENPNQQVVPTKNIKVKITHKYLFGFKTETWEKSLTDISFIPKGSLPIALHQQGKVLKKGKYQVKVTITRNEGEKSTTLEKEFSLTAREVKEINQKAKEVIYDYTLILILIVLSLLILLIAVLFLAVKQNKKIKQKNHS